MKAFQFLNIFDCKTSNEPLQAKASVDEVEVKTVETLVEPK